MLTQMDSGQLRKVGARQENHGELWAGLVSIEKLLS